MAAKNFNQIPEFHFIQEQIKEMELTKSIMELQKHVKNDTEHRKEISKASDQELLALASISPLLGPTLNPISETCRGQSMHYLSELFSDQPWAKKSKRYTRNQLLASLQNFPMTFFLEVFNSNGKRPNGMMSYFFDECTAQSHFNQSECPADFDVLNYPLGHQLSMGSFTVNIKIT